MKRITGIRNWARWEFSRDTEPSKVLFLIAADRFLRATVLIIGSVVLGFALTSFHHSVVEIQNQLTLNSGGSILHDLLRALAVKFFGLTLLKQYMLALGMLLYGAMELTEGIGLMRHRRWAEYLVLLATFVFMPFEGFDVVSKPTALRVATLVVNTAIFFYLIFSKRLFLERPPAIQA